VHRPKLWVITAAVLVLLAVALVMLTSHLRPTESQREDAEELAKLRGTWVCVGYASEGNDDAPLGQALASGLNTTYSITGNTCTCTWGVPGVGGKTISGAITLHPEQSPKGIDWAYQYEGKEVTKLGIYEVEGDKLRLCWALTGEDRPKYIRTKKGDGQIVGVMLLERENR
jgi:uncharacterized protein (TIGR03067 family)